jgi:UDP-N-acetyl-D-glucosamine dehydrogenase
MTMNMRSTEQLSLKSVAIIGLGYVGLPTALALHDRCQRVIGIDVSQNRLDEITARHADLNEPDKVTLGKALADGTFEMTTSLAASPEADAVIICVPTPVDAGNVPDLTLLRAACASVVSNARPGQTLILTSTTYVGTTTELLVEPLEARGLRVGTDVFVAFSPERIDPGNPDHLQRETPRVVGGTTGACTAEAVRVLSQVADEVHPLSSPEAAEATKLYENIQRAVTLALANEFADACRLLSLDPIEVTAAAATKPYSFLAVNPGPGVGGHCIPVDPHYLLWQLHQHGHGSPLIEQAMTLIDNRPGQVAARAGEILAADDCKLADAKILVAGVSYKPGVRDLRQSSAIPLINGLLFAGAEVSYHDPLIPSVRLADETMASTPDPHGEDYDLVIIHTMHPGVNYAWAEDCPRILDATYCFTGPKCALLEGRRTICCS